MHQFPFRLWRRIFDNRPVGFPDLAFAKHLIHPFQSLTRFSKKNNTRYGTIYTMRNPDKNFARFIVFFLQPLFNGFRERCVAGFIALNNFGTCFVDSDDMIIFVKNVHQVFIPPSI